MNLLNRLTLAQRISAVGCLTLLTISFALFYFIQEGFSKDIEFATLEQHGNRFQQPLEDLLLDVSQHQLLARQAGGGSSDGRATLTELEGKVDAALKDLRGADAKYGRELQFTPEGLSQRKRDDAHWEVLQTEWDAIKAASGKTAEEADKAHESMIANVRAMIAQAGDTSNLILDSDLDSYYLMDGTLVTLPQTEDRLTAMEKLGQDSLGKGPLSAEQRIQFSVASALLGESDRDRMAGDAQTALNEDRNFHGTSPSLQQNLPLAMQSYLDANKGLIDLIGNIVSDQGGAVTQAQYASAIDRVRTASFNLSHVGMRELDVLLQMRIDDLAQHRLIALLWTALALFLSSGIALGVIRSVSRSLQGMSERLMDRSQQISSASLEMASASQTLADGASSQAASLEETCATTEEINAMARRNTENSRAAAELVMESQSRVEATDQLLNEMVGSMAGIAEGSVKISGIIKVIDEIAFQTNLLALNAAVEAARAGEAGAGFAVVADEVRSLSQRCAQAAKETSELIEESIAKTAEGRGKVDKVVSAIQLVTGDSVKLKALVEEVNVGSVEQTLGIQMMANALTQMDRVTQGNAASAQQGASSVENLKSQADALVGIVDEVTTLVGSASGPSSLRSVFRRRRAA
jgi:Methyl-accepting chemotaxis protein (MCP) signalling domain